MNSRYHYDDNLENDSLLSATNGIRSMVLLLVFFSVLSFMRASLWSDMVLIWGDAVSKSPRGYRALNNLGGAYREKGMWDEAAASWRAALEINPYYSPSHSSLAGFYMEREMWVESEEELLLALRVGPKYEDIYRRLGYIHAKLGDFDRAIADFEEALALNRESEYSIRGLVKLYTDKGYRLGEGGDYTGALFFFKKANALDPKNLSAIYGLALSYEEAQNYGDALRYWDYYLAVAPADDPYTDSAANHSRKLRTIYN